MKNEISKVSLSIGDKNFHYLVNLALSAGISVSDLLKMFVDDLVADPDPSNSAEDMAQAWYCLHLPDEGKRLTFPLWLDEKRQLDFVYCMFSSLLSHIPFATQAALDPSRSSDELRLLQAEALLHQGMFGCDPPFQGIVLLSLGDFSSAAQELILQIFNAIRRLYHQYAEEQDLEPEDKDCLAEVFDVFRIWKDQILRY